MPDYKANRAKRYKLLTDAGFSHNEAMEFSRQYTVTQLRTLPYLVNMRKWRRLYGARMAGLGYGEKEINRGLVDIYKKRDWITDGKLDPWKMLKSFRKTAIDSGEYIPKKSSHHSRAEITQREVNEQARRVKIIREIDRDVWGDR